MIYAVILFVIGIILSFFFTKLGYRLPLGEDMLEPSRCDKCNHELKLIEKIPIISYIIQRGKCKYCNQKISRLYLPFEIMTGILFVLTYFVFINDELPHLKIIFGLFFISGLIIICYSDIKYMIISDEILIVFTSIIVILKLYIIFRSEEILTLLDLGYEVIFMLIDAFVMYFIMFVIKKLGDLVFKKESLGNGDLKLMIYIAIVMGWKLSIIIIFIGSFLALIPSIINNYKKDKVMLPFGPFLAISTMILFLMKVDFNSLLELLH